MGQKPTFGGPIYIFLLIFLSQLNKRKSGKVGQNIQNPLKSHKKQLFYTKYSVFCPIFRHFSGTHLFLKVGQKWAKNGPSHKITPKIYSRPYNPTQVLPPIFIEARIKVGQGPDFKIKSGPKFLQKCKKKSQGIYHPSFSTRYSNAFSSSIMT